MQVAMIKYREYNACTKLHICAYIYYTCIVHIYITGLLNSKPVDNDEINNETASIGRLNLRSKFEAPVSNTNGLL